MFNGICNLEHEVQSDSDNCMLETPPCQLKSLQLKIMFKLPRRNTEQNQKHHHKNAGSKMSGFKHQPHYQHDYGQGDRPARHESEIGDDKIISKHQ